VTIRLAYDEATDGLYIELRPMPAKRTRGIAEDVMLDLGTEASRSAMTSSTPPQKAS
jgi:uncharacterized protein YuzE